VSVGRGRRDGRKVRRPHLHQARHRVVHVLDVDREAAGFGGDLRHEVGEAQRRIDAGRRDLIGAGDQGGGDVAAGIRREPRKRVRGHLDRASRLSDMAVYVGLTLKKKVLNIGGGDKRIPIPPYFDGWTHHVLDIDPKTKADVVMDARRLMELPGGRYDAIYCSHNIEHYYAHDVPKVLAGMRHMLKPEGFVDIRCPDIGTLIQVAAAKWLDIEDTLYHSTAGPITVRDLLYGYGREIEESGSDFYAHKTGFTRQSLQRALGAFFPVVVFPPPVATTLELQAGEMKAFAFLSHPSNELRDLLKI
jgi:hypothetical protein